MKRLLFAAFMLLSTICFAQIDDPGGNPDEPVPLDGGVTLLAASGIAYAAKKISDARKEKRSNQL